MHPAAKFETERLVAQPYALADFEDLARLWGDPEVTRFIGGKPKTTEEVWGTLLRTIGHWSVFGFGYWLLREKRSGRFAGELGFADHHRVLEPGFGTMPEMGWVLTPEFHGQGLAEEAARAALAWADARDWPKTVCMIDPDNRRSLSLAARLGFREYARADYRDAEAILFERCRA